MCCLSRTTGNNLKVQSCFYVVSRAVLQQKLSKKDKLDNIAIRIRLLKTSLILATMTPSEPRNRIISE